MPAEQYIERTVNSYTFRGTITNEVITMVGQACQQLCSEVVPRAKHRRFFHVINELLQNVMKHSNVPKHNVEWAERPHLFSCTHQEGLVTLTTSNPMLNERVPALKQHIDWINSQSSDAIRSSYLNILFHKPISADGNAGLGLIEIAKSARTAIEYHFRPMGATHQLLTITATMNFLQM